MTIPIWAKNSIKKQTSTTLKYNLKVGNMTKEMKEYIKKILKSRKI